ISDADIALMVENTERAVFQRISEIVLSRNFWNLMEGDKYIKDVRKTIIEGIFDKKEAPALLTQIEKLAKNISKKIFLNKPRSLIGSFFAYSCNPFLECFLKVISRCSLNLSSEAGRFFLSDLEKLHRVAIREEFLGGSLDENFEA